MNAGPFLSVVVITSRHREFVADALGSIRRQTLPRERYELLVVRDYDDEALERLVTGMGGRTLSVPPGDIGPAIAAGVSASRGELLSFLDDDDRFVPEKLERVVERFRADPELGFLKNGYAVIDSDGRRLPEAGFRAGERAASSRLGPVLLHGSRDIPKLRTLPALGVGFNSSTMTIRRGPLEAFLRHLDLTGFRLLDELAFYAGLASDLTLRFDPEILTEYRIHAQNVSSRPGRERDPLAGRAAFSRVIVPSYVKLWQATQALGKPLVEEEAHALVEVERGYALLRDPASTRSHFLQALRTLRRWNHTYVARSERPLALALPLFVLSPYLGRRLYARRVRASEP